MNEPKYIDMEAINVIDSASIFGNQPPKKDSKQG